MRNKQKWQQIIEQWQQSGVSQAEFCRIHGLDTKQFYNWKYRLDKSNEKKSRFMNILVPEQSTCENRKNYIGVDSNPAQKLRISQCPGGYCGF